MTAPASGTVHRTELEIGGMTCGACVNRVERKLAKLPGVTAGVNLATRRATVEHPPSVAADELIAAVTAAGFTASPVDTRGGDHAVPDEPDDAFVDLENRLAVCVPFAVAVIVIAMAPPLQFVLWQWASLLLTLPVVLWCAWPFHRGAVAALRHGTSTMDTLVSVGTLTALGYSVVALTLGTAGLPGHRHTFHLAITATDPGSQIYFEVAAGITLFVLLGRYLEARSRRRAGAALRELAELGADEAVVVRDDVEVRMRVADVTVGEHVVVRPGMRIPVDGTVTAGRAAVDVSSTTGESAPSDTAVDDAVTAGSLVRSGLLVVRADRVGARTRLARIGALVARAQAGKASAQRLADRVSGVFVPVVITVAVATFGFWAGRGTAGTGFAAAAAVLVVACPCALGLATPTALLAGTTAAARRGILVSGPESLERSRRVDTVVLDKTGTLTTGAMRVSQVVPADGEDAGEALRRAAVLESASAHPIAVAICRAAGDAPAPVAAYGRALDGLGVVGDVDGTTVTVGSPALLGTCGHALPDELVAPLAGSLERGSTTVAVGWASRVRALVVVDDTVRPDAAAAVAGLRAAGLEPVLLTGDADGPARVVAAAVGIDRVVAGAAPEQKAEHVAALQADGRVVAMVGDGVNDAAALATADLGIAMGGGTDLASAAADITLVRDDLVGVGEAIRTARRTLRTIRANLVWAFAYNVLALPVAAAGLLNPMLAGAAMAASSLIVVANSLRLSRT